MNDGPNHYPARSGGGILALLIIREVLTFLKGKKSGHEVTDTYSQDIQALRIVLLGMEGQGGMVAEIKKLHERIHKQESEIIGLRMKSNRMEDQSRRGAEGGSQK